MTTEALSSGNMGAMATTGPRGPKPKTLTIGRIGVYAFLILSALFFLLPLWVMIVTSLKAMPEIRILPYPVFPEQVRREGWWRWPGTTSLLIREYNKYLVALVRGIALPSESASAP